MFYVEKDDQNSFGSEISLGPKIKIGCHSTRRGLDMMRRGILTVIIFFGCTL